MPKLPDDKDPEGTETMSRKEAKDNLNRLTRDILRVPPEKPTDDPEGTEKS
jgi:hypothetical protein